MSTWNQDTYQKSLKGRNTHRKFAQQRMTSVGQGWRDNRSFVYSTDGKPHLSANQLVDFLNDVQRDPRLNEILHPYADLQRAKDLIKTYEHNKYHQQRSQLTFDGFLRFVICNLYDKPVLNNILWNKVQLKSFYYFGILSKKECLINSPSHSLEEYFITPLFASIFNKF